MVNPYFNNAIPQANDALSKSQRDLLGNNSQLNIAWNVDHESFNVADQGKHNLVTMPARTSDPQVPATSPTEMIMFCQLDASNNPVIKIKPGGVVAANRTGQQISPFPSVLAYFKAYSTGPGSYAFGKTYRCSLGGSGGNFTVTFDPGTITDPPGTPIIPIVNLMFSVQIQHSVVAYGSVGTISTAGNGSVAIKVRLPNDTPVEPDSITFFMWGDA